MATRYLDKDDFLEWYRSEITVEDELVEDAINTATELLDGEDGLHRRIELAGVAAATERMFVVDGCRLTQLWLDDCVEVVSITERGATLTEGLDFQLMPLNGLLNGEARPYDTALRIHQFWDYYDGLATIAVTARWGWESIPKSIVEACKIVTKEVLENRDVKLGLFAVTDAGGVGTRENALVKRVLKTYRSPRAARAMFA